MNSNILLLLFCKKLDVLTGSESDHIFSVSFRRSWSQHVEGGSSTVQLHSTQLLCIPAWGAKENRCHFLAQLPIGAALWWKLCLLRSSVLRLPMCSRKGHQEIPWGKYESESEIHCLPQGCTSSNINIFFLFLNHTFNSLWGMQF